MSIPLLATVFQKTIAKNDQKNPRKSLLLLLQMGGAEIPA
jgi:hypothetical protein